ncbi:MAG: RNA-binding protein, partial [Burkholderiaceae bacterium]|nr:RNA-binding protein [Burkholderiaceae bacterium]
MTDKNPDPTLTRLAKRVAEQLNCSRSTAEQFVEGGFVSVDGQIEEAPGARVRPDQAVTVA